jgi:hypothetical protein
LPSRLSYFSERLELSLRWSAPGRRTRRGLVIPTRRCTPGGTRGARLYAATGASCPAARTRDILARIVNGARRAARTWTRFSPLPSPPPAVARTREPLRRPRGLGRQARARRRPACAASALPERASDTVSAGAHRSRATLARRLARSSARLCNRRLRPLVWAHCRGQPSRAAPASSLTAAAALPPPSRLRFLAA